MEVGHDIYEIRQLLVQAVRENTKRLLSAELDRLVTLQKQQAASTPAKPVSSEHKVYDKRLTEYAWDQSDKFVKFYINLKNVQSVSSECVSHHFEQRSFNFRVENLNGVNYVFEFKNLLETIDPQASKFKVKTDSIVVMLAKNPTGVHWSHLTSTEKKADAARSSKYDNSMKDDSDPSAGIMNLMKKMYDEGDDEMKKTITKAWVESREKQAADGMM